MANFDIYAPILRSWEGGFVNDPSDAGGATNCGVTLETYKAIINPNATIQDLKNMTDAQWRKIMKCSYWDKCLADQIKDQSVAEIFVDWCINSGLGMIRKVQGIIGTKADGIMGPMSIAALNKTDARRLHYSIKSARAEHYDTCVKNRSANLKFYDGWMKRLSAFNFGKQTLTNK